MITLVNDQVTRVGPGKYSLKVSGALDIQWQLVAEGFTTIPDGGFTAETGVSIDLPACDFKVANAGANTVTMSLITK